MRRLAMLACVVCAASAHSAPAAADSGVAVLTPAQLPHNGTPVEQRIHPRKSLDPAALAAGKAAAQNRASFANPLGGLRSPRAAAPLVSAPLNQAGLAAGDNAMRNLGTPPDPTGAVGPANYVEFVNSVVRVYDKSLTALSTTQLDTFVGDTGSSVFDPQIQWDQQGQRWVYLAADCTAATCAGTNYLAYGFSQTTDPTGGWCNYFIRVDNAGGTGLFDDYPKLGHDDTHLIFGVNVFDGNSFVSARIWTVPKPAAGSLASCPPPPTAHWWSGSASSPAMDQALASQALTTADGTLAFTPVPADTGDASPSGYIVAADDPGSGSASQIMVWHVDSAGALVADGNVGVSSYAVPLPVPQPGTSDSLDSSDARLTQAVALRDPDAGAEAVWTQHTIDSATGRSVVRWYEIIPSTLTKRQEGNVGDPSAFIFNGAISPTGAGNEAAIQYNAGGATLAAQIRAASRASTSPLGTMGDQVTLASNSNIDQDRSCPSASGGSAPCRWGDYAGATPDPADPHVVWGTNQLNGPPNGDTPAWITQNFALRVPVSPQAAFTTTPSASTRLQAVTFDASGSRDPDGGAITSYAWDFGDGTTATTTAPTIVHTYSRLGTFHPALVVTDSDDSLQSNAASGTVTVVNVPPTAALSASPRRPIAGKRVTLSAAGSRDSDGTIVDYRWDLDGNGTFETDTGTTARVSRVYRRAATRIVRVQVQDSDGATATRAMALRVGRRLTLQISVARRGLAQVVRTGLPVRARCSLRCTVRIRLVLSRSLARRLDLTSRTIATGRRTLRGRASAVVVLKVTRRSRSAVRNLATLRATVTATAIGAGQRASAGRRVTLRR